MPEASVAVIASSTASQRQRIQRLGRILRKANGKTEAVVYTLFATEEEKKRLGREAANLDGITTVEWQLRAGCRPMPRLFHKSEWFHELSPNALAETEFESLLIQNSDIVRPNTSIVPYKKTVYAGERSARADLAIISHDYRKWTVVEVEMVRHDLHRHVVPQIDTLRNGRYEQSHAEYLAARAPHLDAGKISQMLRGEPPEVLVIVNKYDEEWGRELHRYGAHMMVFEYLPLAYVQSPHLLDRRQLAGRRARHTDRAVIRAAASVADGEISGCARFPTRRASGSLYWRAGHLLGAI